MDNSILLFVIAVLIPDPPIISKLSPNATLKFVEVSSPIVIELNAQTRRCDIRNCIVSTIYNFVS